MCHEIKFDEPFTVTNQGVLYLYDLGRHHSTIFALWPVKVKHAVITSLITEIKQI